MRLAGAIALPNSICAIGVSGIAIHQAKPEHLTRPFGRDYASRGHELFITRLAIDDGHDRDIRVRLPHVFDSVGNGIALAMRSLEHIQIKEGWTIGDIARGESMKPGGMNRQQPVKRIGRTNVPHNVAPIAGLLAVIEGEILYLVPGQIGLTGRTPNYRP